MTAPSGETCGGGVEPLDVLTFDEESALGAIREIVNAIRAGGRAAQVKEVEKAVMAVGGTVFIGADAGGSKIYGLSGARFSLSADSGSDGAIILSFIPAAR
jgi:hypothetical protein